jgi:hypothetical protein
MCMQISSLGRRNRNVDANRRLAAGVMICRSNASNPRPIRAPRQLRPLDRNLLGAFYLDALFREVSNNATSREAYPFDSGPAICSVSEAGRA